MSQNRYHYTPRIRNRQTPDAYRRRAHDLAANIVDAQISTRGEFHGNPDNFNNNRPPNFQPITEEEENLAISEIADDLLDHIHRLDDFVRSISGNPVTLEQTNNHQNQVLNIYTRHVNAQPGPNLE